MRYALASDFEKYMGEELSDLNRRALSTLANSKLEMLDGLRLYTDTDEVPDLVNEPTLKEYLFSGRAKFGENEKNFLATMSSGPIAGEYFQLYELGEIHRKLNDRIYMYHSYGANHDNLLISFYIDYLSIKFVDGENVVKVSLPFVCQESEGVDGGISKSNPEPRNTYHVSLYTNTVGCVGLFDGGTLLPDAEFNFVRMGDGSIKQFPEGLTFVLPPVMGKTDLLYDMWRIGKYVSECYNRSYENGLPKQLTR